MENGNNSMAVQMEVPPQITGPTPAAVPAGPVALSKGFYRESGEGYSGGTIPPTVALSSNQNKQLGEQTSFVIKEMDHATGAVSTTNVIRERFEGQAAREVKEAAIRAGGGMPMDPALMAAPDTPAAVAEPEPVVAPAPAAPAPQMIFVPKAPLEVEEPAPVLVPDNAIKLRVAGKNLPTFTIRAMEVILAESSVNTQMVTVVVITDPKVMDLEFPLGEYELTVLEENGVIASELGYTPVTGCVYAGQSFLVTDLRYSVFSCFRQE